MGRPKAWLPFGGERMLARVVRRLGAAAEPIVVVAAVGQDLPPVDGAALIVRDAAPDRGPLQGLATGLASLPETVGLVFATATDVPLIRPAWVRRLVELIGDDDLAMPLVDGFHQPLAALYRRASVLPVVMDLLKADLLRPVGLVERLRSRIVSADELRTVDPDLDTLRNVNTPEQHREALERAGLPRKGLETPSDVTIEFYGVPRLRASVARVKVSAPTIGEALKAAAIAVPSLAGEVIIGDRLAPSCRLNWNGERFLSDPDVPLMDGDTLIVLSADVGG